jgi:hypothetical protein
VTGTGLLAATPEVCVAGSDRDHRGRSSSGGRGDSGAFVELGTKHILSGWNHLAFVLALVLASGTLGACLGMVTASTLAHSVTPAPVVWRRVGSVAVARPAPATSRSGSLNDRWDRWDRWAG